MVTPDAPPAAGRRGAPVRPRTRTRLTPRGRRTVGALAGALVVLVVAVARSGAGGGPAQPPAPGPQEPVVVESFDATATYYGPGLEGGTTASGEAFDAGALAAAHATLPFGTDVRVTRTDDGRSVVVEVNDRLPSKRADRIDLTPAAADALGMRREGRVGVLLEVLATVPRSSG